MSVTYLSPTNMLQPVPYHHVAIGYGSRHVYVAGQVAQGEDGSPIASNLRGQVAQALRSTARGLAAADVSFQEVVRLTFYVASWSPEKIEDFMAGVNDVSAELDLPTPLPPASLIGVECLFEPDVYVEIEATAIAD